MSAERSTANFMRLIFSENIIASPLTCQGEKRPCPPSFLKRPCVVAWREERGSPAEWAGQDWPGTNPFDSAKKGQKRVSAGKEQEVKPDPRKNRCLIQPRDPRFPPGRARPYVRQQAGETSLGKKSRGSSMAWSFPSAVSARWEGFWRSFFGEG